MYKFETYEEIYNSDLKKIVFTDFLQEYGIDLDTYMKYLKDHNDDISRLHYNSQWDKRYNVSWVSNLFDEYIKEDDYDKMKYFSDHEYIWQELCYKYDEDIFELGFNPETFEIIKTK
jgi:hypothetical protein